MTTTNPRVDPDYARKLWFDRHLLEAELEHLRSEWSQHPSAELPTRPGISVIIATCTGASRIDVALRSLIAQTLQSDSYEVIVVHNGPDDGTAQVVGEIRRLAPEHTFRYVYRAIGSTGGARNLGVDMAAREYVTFVDDDDWVEPEFLERLLAVSATNVVAVVPITDIHADGVRNESSTLGTRIRALRPGAPVPIDEVPWLLGFNASKAIATDLARLFRYDEALTSGEDLVYWAQLLSRAELSCVFAGDFSCSYMRVHRDDSVSRRELDFDFSVFDRLAVIRALEQTAYEADPMSGPWRARKALIDAQAGFIRRYLQQRPDEVDRVANAIHGSGVALFPWKVLNQGRATDLVFAYCFAPFSDTSAVVASKAIAERRRIADVISNDMTGVRRLDPAVSVLADRWIDEKIVIQTKAAFADWALISSYAERANAEAERRHVGIDGGYKSVYSRALWVGSHVAASIFKIRHWQIPWTAEFSDPLRTDAEGLPRKGKLVDNSIARQLVQAIESRGFRVEQAEMESLFALVEKATMVLADELIFTNQNQLDYMLEELEPKLVERVLRKAVVRRHPSPSSSDYSVAKSDYETARGALNIGYFGSFYANRGLDDVLTAIANMPAGDRRELRLHIFSNKPVSIRQRVAERGLGANVVASAYLPYMEFLNVLSKFDVLLVNDVERSRGQTINPFLPSKLSDYSGSHRRIWGIYDQGSSLSRSPLTYRSPIGDVPKIMDSLSLMLRDWREGA